jgi:hemerythrin-like domain-containing protein
MRSIELLLQEHRAIELMLDVLDRAARRLQAGGAVERAFMEQLFEFFERFGDAGHHSKEELCLFPVLARHGLGPDTAPIGALISQHEVGRVYLADLRATFERTARGDKTAGPELVMLATEYRDMLREHIWLEDQYFVEFATGVMTEDEDEELVGAMRDGGAAMAPADRRRYLDLAARHREISARW